LIEKQEREKETDRRDWVFGDGEGMEQGQRTSFAGGQSVSVEIANSGKECKHASTQTSALLERDDLPVTPEQSVQDCVTTGRHSDRDWNSVMGSCGCLSSDSDKEENTFKGNMEVVRQNLTEQFADFRVTSEQDGSQAPHPLQLCGFGDSGTAFEGGEGWVPDDAKESILQHNDERFCLLPVKYHRAYEFYKMAQASYWTVEEVDLSQDKRDWEKLTAQERHFISYVLAFFAASDGIVLENLAVRFMQGMKKRKEKMDD